MQLAKIFNSKLTHEVTKPPSANTELQQKGMRSTNKLTWVMVSAQTWCLETEKSLFIYQLLGIYGKSISRHKITQQSTSRKKQRACHNLCIKFSAFWGHQSNNWYNHPYQTPLQLARALPATLLKHFSIKVDEVLGIHTRHLQIQESNDSPQTQEAILAADMAPSVSRKKLYLLSLDKIYILKIWFNWGNTLIVTQPLTQFQGLFSFP